MHRLDIGRVGELIVTQQLIERGWQVFTPVSSNTRVDMIAINGSRLVKLQVKTTTGTSAHESFGLRLHKTQADPQYDYFYEAGDFDFFAVVHLPTRSVVYIATEEALQSKYSVVFSFQKDREKRPDNKKRFVEDYATL